MSYIFCNILGRILKLATKTNPLRLRVDYLQKTSATISPGITQMSVRDEKQHICITVVPITLLFRYPVNSSL